MVSLLLALLAEHFARRWRREDMEKAGLLQLMRQLQEGFVCGVAWAFSVFCKPFLGGRFEKGLGKKCLVGGGHKVCRLE